MQELSDLLDSTQGREFLKSREVFSDKADFAASVQAPANPLLLERLGLSASQCLICTGQQLYLDYGQSIVDKLMLSHALEQIDSLQSCFIWQDTDRSAADPLMNKFIWYMNGKEYPVRVAPPKTNEIEARFVTLEGPILEKNMQTLRSYLFQSPVKDKARTKDRYERLVALFHEGDGMSLSQFNLQITRLLLEEVLQLKPRTVLLSTLLNEGLFTAEINYCINRLDDFVKVFNQGITELKEQGINPQVRPLPDDYFPLHFSSPTDGHRMRLRHQIEGKDHFAIGQGADGQVYKFPLGRDELSIDSIASTGRWSPDVSFPIFLNDLVSGYIMGKSSALYGLVMRKVMTEVLDKKPVPFLTTPGSPSPNSGHPDSLLWQYLIEE